MLTAERFQVHAGHPAVVGAFASEAAARELASVLAQVRAITRGAGHRCEPQVVDAAQAWAVLAFTDHPEGGANVRVFQLDRVLQRSRVLFTGDRMECLKFALMWCSTRVAT